MRRIGRAVGQAPARSRPGVAEAVVAVDRAEEVRVRVGRVERIVAAELDAHHRRLEAVDRVAERVGRARQRLLADERVAGDGAGGAVLGPLPRLGLVAVDPVAERVGAVGREHVAVRGAARRRRVRVAGDRLEEVDLQARDAGLVVLDRRLRRVDLVAGRAVADGADDAAVVTRGVRLDAPVEAAGEADDGQVADVDARAEHGRRRRLVVGLVGDAGGLPAVGVGLEHVELVERIGLVEVVVAGDVGQRDLRSLILDRVVAGLDR